MMKHTVTLSVLCLALLAGCSNVKQQLGVGRHSPDEFTVVKRAPLSMPPEYTLRAPATGSAPAAAIASNQAKTILLGEPAQDIAAGNAEEQMLARLGAGAADPNIRNVIAEENGYIALENQRVVDKLIFWEENAPTEADIPASEVDPRKEAERLRANRESGRPANAGDVPVIEKKEEGAIDKLF
jgi:hypothetical protein